jgi:hypothetical protein
MKTKITILGLTLIIAMILVSCGGSNKTIVTVDKVSITGEAKDYMAVVPGAYEITKTKGTFGEELTLSIKFKVTNSFDQSKIGEYTEFESMHLQIINDKGSPIDLDFSPSGVTDYDKIKSLLKGKPGDEVTVVFKSDEMNRSEEAIAEVMKNAKGVEITCGDIINLVTEPIIDNSASAEDADSSTDDSSDCEQFITDYEEFVADYIKVLKKYKANPSDTSILTEYTELAQKASEMQSQASDCTDLKYATRLLQLSNKMAKAAL